MNYIIFSILGRTCNLDNGDHCVPDIYLTQSNVSIDCFFFRNDTNALSSPFYNSAGSIDIIQPKGDRLSNPSVPTAVSIKCPYDNVTALVQNNKIFIKLKIGDNQGDNNHYQSVIDICYQHVEKREDAVICTSPMFGFPSYNNNKFDTYNTFWHGHPPYRNHTILDAFIAYHAVLMNLRVAIYDVDETVQTYLFSKYKNILDHHQKLYYRSNWALSEIRQGPEMETNKHPITYSYYYYYEELAMITCHWENRIIANWFFLYGVDNFVIPTIHNKSIIDILRTINSSVSGLLIPMWWSCKNHEHNNKDNVLIRWNNGTIAANWGIRRTVPLGIIIEQCH